jgi:2-hydroxy-3-oxopropionate reductase
MIGFIGLGSMGAGMAHCLLRKNFPLTVFARNAPATAEFGKAGAKVAASPRELGAACEIVFLSLPDAPAVEQVLFGKDGLAQGLAAGGIVVDTSTIAAHSARDFADRLAAKGVRMLDAPVSGGQQGARDGTLTCMAGGPREAFEKCREAAAAFSRNFVLVGPQGAGQAVKACNQVAVAGAMMGLAEAMAMARKQGVDLGAMRDILMGGTAKSFVLEKHAQRIIDGSFTPGFRATLMRKDLNIALESASDPKAQMPVTATAAALLDEVCESGRADWDWIALALRVQQLNGLEVPDTKEKSQ